MPIQNWSDMIWVSRPIADPGFAEEMDELHGRLIDLPNNMTPSIVVDLEDAAMLNSSNLSQLLRLRKLMTDRDREVRLVAPNDSVWSTFTATGLDRVFTFAPNMMAALADLQGGD